MSRCARLRLSRQCRLLSFNLAGQSIEVDVTPNRGRLHHPGFSPTLLKLDDEAALHFHIHWVLAAKKAAVNAAVSERAYCKSGDLSIRSSALRRAHFKPSRLRNSAFSARSFSASSFRSLWFSASSSTNSDNESLATGCFAAGFWSDTTAERFHW
jgi:hypothetical protein